MLKQTHPILADEVGNLLVTLFPFGLRVSAEANQSRSLVNLFEMVPPVQE